MNLRRIIPGIVAICFTFALCEGALGQVRLPRLISDGMVLQRDTEIKLHGWASVNEPVTLVFNGADYKTEADSLGNWQIALPPQHVGGPYKMVFKGKNEITVENILFGDVWVCSGQSNMELTMERVKEKYRQVIEQAENPHIRQFLVPDAYDFKNTHSDVDAGSWVSAGTESILTFSAVAYFFAREIYDRYHVPVGLINAALGGSPAEAWMSEDALMKFPGLYKEVQRFKSDELIESIEAGDKNRIDKWYSELNARDSGIADHKLKWTAPGLDDDDWHVMDVPGYWAEEAAGPVNGVMWFRKKVDVPASMAGKAASLWLGRLVDQDSVFINGRFAGTTGYQYPPRRYALQDDILKEGKNTIVVRLINNSGRGGFVPDKPYFLAAGSDTLDLKGPWKYKLGAAMPPLKGPTFIRWKPAGLYNRMIAPLLRYPVKGVIWYQGESNTGRPEEYATLFPALIRNWRQKWGQGDFPFIYVQLTNFMEAKDRPAESNWAGLREAQRKTLKVPNTGMAVTIDLGEWNDIHPQNKEDVGKRLALSARKVAYGEKDLVSTGPLYKVMRANGNKVVITFTGQGSGLIAKGGGELKGFAIAGADGRFVWARAKIESDNKVMVWHNDIAAPVAVRYAWADNPEGANLYNKEGLPASPFGTDKK